MRALLRACLRMVPEPGLRGGGSPLLQQGELDFGPAEKRSIFKGMGFTGCGKTRALYQGTTLVVP